MIKLNLANLHLPDLLLSDLNLANDEHFAQRRSLEVAAVAVGGLAGVTGAFFQLGAEQVAVQKDLVAKMMATESVPGWSWAGLLSALMLLVSLWLVRRFAPESAGSGIQEVEGFLDGVRSARWWRVLPVKFIGGILSLGSGMVMGREGPSIQMGGSCGAMISDKSPEGNATSSHALVAAGAAAGLAAAFNAPLAGLFFVMEEMRSTFRYSFLNVRLLSIAVLTATLIVNLIVGEQPALQIPVYETPAWKEMSLYLLMGGFLGVTGAALNKAILKGLDAMEHLHRSPKKIYGYIALLGFGVGVTHFIFPDMVGGGYGLVDSVLDGNLATQGLFLAIVVRFAFTVICFCSGVPGGVFAPMVVLGTLIGLWCGDIAGMLFPTLTQNPYPFAVAGMGALFAATVQAPVTGIVLVVEMTANYSLIIPVMIACVGADIVAHELGTRPLYAVLLERLVKPTAITPAS